MEIQLDKLNVFELGMLFPIIISEPNSEWFELFEIEKTKIEQTILKCNIIQINHIGSTAIPNLKAKPTIDIILEIHESTDNELRNC
jgi:GrpB-like predicted nucleotidyltransferase (UPF0157 family)